MKKKEASQGVLPLPGILYDERFLESHVGSRILHEPETAIVELTANAWDAGATEVRIQWPDRDTGRGFWIEDNGIGMTDVEFKRRWSTLSYNRVEEQGSSVLFPGPAKKTRASRVAFGSNGVGRWAGFCFGEAYFVDTAKEGRRNRYRISRGADAPFTIKQEIFDQAAANSGTKIECPSPRSLSLSAAEAREDIGMRFLTDPDFAVWVDAEKVSFSDIHSQSLRTLSLDIGDGLAVELIVIDTHATDRTNKQHGVAWHVGGRLVGTCSWKHSGTDDLIDGRRIAAKRFTFIVRADYLGQKPGAIKKDWSEFERDHPEFQRSAQVVYPKVQEILLASSEEDRQATLQKARDRSRDVLQTLGPLQRERWTGFITKAQESCPSIKESDILKLAEVVAKMEQAKSGYALLHKLGEYGPDQLDDLHRLLDDWTLDMAKAVLDEVGRRLKVVDELRIRTASHKTEEVQDLQPLFDSALWIFGPEFETIEYTSNEGMTSVVQKLFKKETEKGSLLRPDFVILPDGTAGLYSYPSYDAEGGEVGIERLVVVELKKPGVKIGSEQKDQCWKYVKELFEKGHLQERKTLVRCFVLGSQLAKLEGVRKEIDDTVEITPMLFETAIQRASSRLLRLHERVKNAPFLQKHRAEIDAFLAPEAKNPNLFDVFSSDASPA